MGISTRSGSGQRCKNSNMPRRGCFGPLDGIKDFGLRTMAGIASIFALENEENLSEEDLSKLMDKLVDPAGLFYMYSLPSSILRRKRMEEK
jgi:F420-non-reducing hydrogenase small subunit